MATCKMMMMMMTIVHWIGSDDYQYSGSILDRLDLDENRVLDRIELEQFLSGFDMMEHDDLDSVLLRLDSNNDSLVSLSEMETYWKETKKQVSIVNWIRYALQLDSLASIFPVEYVKGFDVVQFLTDQKVDKNLWRSVAANVLALGTGKKVAF